MVRKTEMECQERKVKLNRKELGNFSVPVSTEIGRRFVGGNINAQNLGRFIPLERKAPPNSIVIDMFSEQARADLQTIKDAWRQQWITSLEAYARLQKIKKEIQEANRLDLEAQQALEEYHRAAFEAEEDRQRDMTLMELARQEERERQQVFEEGRSTGRREAMEMRDELRSDRYEAELRNEVPFERGRTMERRADRMTPGSGRVQRGRGSTLRYTTPEEELDYQRERNSEAQRRYRDRQRAELEALVVQEQTIVAQQINPRDLQQTFNEMTQEEPQAEEDQIVEEEGSREIMLGEH